MKKKKKPRKIRNLLGRLQSLKMIFTMNITFALSGILAIISLFTVVVTTIMGNESPIIITITIVTSSTTAISFVYSIFKSISRQNGIIIHEYTNDELKVLYDEAVEESGYSLLECGSSKLMYSIIENSYIEENINNIPFTFKGCKCYKIPKNISLNAYRIFHEYLAKKKYFFNGKKIRMNIGFEKYIKNNVSQDFTPFPLSKTNYFNSICTNEISNKEFRYLEDTSYCFDGFRLIKSKEENGKRARLYSLSESQCSNHIGISTLAITSDNYVFFTMQGDKNLVGSNKYVVSASGSVDYKDSKSSKNLGEIIINAMNRELCEECNIQKNNILNTRIIGFGRLLDRGGKPEFFGITHLNMTSDQFLIAAYKSHEIKKELVGNFIKVKNTINEIEKEIEKLGTANQITIQLLYYSKLLSNKN